MLGVVGVLESLVFNAFYPSHWWEATGIASGACAALGVGDWWWTRDG
jgi:hypothetical protein